MAYLEVIARAKVRPGQLEGVKAQAAEILRLTREEDTHTLRCDWFINEDGTECEVHEMFPDEQGLIEPRNRGGCLGDEETGVTSWPAPVCWNG